MRETGEGRDDELVTFHAGTTAKGQYRCAGCGYGVMVHDVLPTCPMCSATSWALSAWTPFANARNLHAARHSSVL